MIIIQIVTNATTSSNTIEYIRNILTAIAILLTIIFGIYTVRQKRRDRLITLRNKLTDILEKLANLNMENAKYRISKTKAELPENYNGLMSDYRRFYVAHAADIVNLLPYLMTYSHELSLIAQAFTAIDDLENAELYFGKSIQRANNSIDSILSERNYARFVFTKVDKERGEILYIKLFEDHKGDSDIMLFYLAETYKRWAVIYLDYGEKDKYNEKLQLARLEFSKMKNTSLKENHIRQIDVMLSPKTTDTSGDKLDIGK